MKPFLGSSHYLTKGDESCSPPWWRWFGVSVLAGLAGIGGSIIVRNVIGGSFQEPVTILAGMAGAFLAGRAVAGAARGLLGRGANVPQVG